jgi:hypothetical protein
MKVAAALDHRGVALRPRVLAELAALGSRAAPSARSSLQLRRQFASYHRNLQQNLEAAPAS